MTMGRFLAAPTALLAALAACNKPAANPPAAPEGPPSLFRIPGEQAAQLQLVTVQAQPIRRPLVVPAQVSFDALRTSDVVPLVDGKVSKLLVREGDRVRSGQPLMSIASPGSADSQAALDRDEATLANANTVLARDRDLYQHKAISLEELQQAELTVASAKASVATDRTRVQVTGTGRGNALLRSPIEGVVVARHISVGESVQAGTTATFTITDPSALWVIAQLYQEDLRRVAVGDPVEIRTPVLETPLAARVSYVGAALDPDTLTIPVRIAAQNPGGVLKSGMYVDAAISPMRTEQAMLVPAAAVLRDADNLPFVYVQAGPNEYARRRIDLGEQVGGSSIVRDGLAAGEKVVGDGALFLQFAENLER
jgi:cobalt-zinc-cadmium efflux system membrane fusion protein